VSSVADTDKCNIDQPRNLAKSVMLSTVVLVSALVLVSMWAKDLVRAFGHAGSTTGGHFPDDARSVQAETRSFPVSSPWDPRGALAR